MNDTLRIQNQTYLILLINPKYDLPTRVVKVSGEGGVPATTTTTSVGARLNGGALGGTNRTEPNRYDARDVDRGGESVSGGGGCRTGGCVRASNAGRRFVVTGFRDPMDSHLRMDFWRSTSTSTWTNPVVFFAVPAMVSREVGAMNARARRCD